MASQKLSQRYHSAVVAGDKEEIARLQAEIDAQMRASYLQPRRPVPVKTILADDNAPAIGIYNFLEHHYKDQWWEWEIETVEAVLMRDFSQAVTEINSDKIQALKLLCNNQLPFTDWYYFNQLAVALSGSVADFNDLKYPSPGMAVACMRVMRQIRPNEEFGSEVKKFVVIILKNEGVYMPPPTVFGILKDDFDTVIKSEWPAVIARVMEMVESKQYDSDSDDVVDIQARRILNVENAAERYGG